MGVKSRDVSRMVASVVTRAQLLQELDRCEVVCCSCHRRRTARRAGWWRLGWRPSDALAFRTTVGLGLAFVFGVLSAGACVDCGEDDLVVLEFDHVGPKRAAVTALAWRGTGLALLRHEIERCEIRCANCHRRRTIRLMRASLDSAAPP